MNKIKLTSGILAGALCLSVITPAFAHQGATGIVKKRMEAMKLMGAEMKSIAEIFKGKAQFDAGRIGMASLIISEHGNEIHKLFPKGTGHKPSRAKDEIWHDKDRFNLLATELINAADAMTQTAKTAKSTAEIMPQLARVGKACKSCHEKFRAPEH